MSTVILNGFRIAGPDGAPHVFEFLDTVRDAMDATHRREYTKVVAAIATRLVDRARAGHEVRGRSPLSVAEAEIQEAHEKVTKTGRRHPELDLQCELTLLSDPADRAGAVYAIVYTEQAAYLDAFAALPGVEDYFYDGRSDAPDDVSDEQWSQRHATWERILDRQPPARRGLAWSMLPPWGKLRPEDVLADLEAAIPDRATRASELAQADPTLKVVDDAGAMLPFTEVVRAVQGRARELEPTLLPVTLQDLQQWPAL